MYVGVVWVYVGWKEEGEGGETKPKSIPRKGLQREPCASDGSSIFAVLFEKKNIFRNNFLPCLLFRCVGVCMICMCWCL